MYWPSAVMPILMREDHWHFNSYKLEGEDKDHLEQRLELCLLLVVWADSRCQVNTFLAQWFEARIRVPCFKPLRKKLIDLATRVLFTINPQADPNIMLADEVQFTAGMLVGALLDQNTTCNLEVEGTPTLVKGRALLGEPYDGYPVCVCMHMQAVLHSPLLLSAVRPEHPLQSSAELN